MKSEIVKGALVALEEEIFSKDFIFRLKNFKEERDALLREINSKRKKGAKGLSALPRKKMIELMNKHNLLGSSERNNENNNF